MEVTDNQWNQSSPREDNKGYHKPFANDWQRQLVTVVNYVFLCGIISLFGIVANVINMLIFYRQGLTTTINISFFALAVSDLSSLIIQQLFNVFINPLCEDLDWPIMYTDVQHLTSGIPREAFARITCLITVYITAERCLCIAFPLHVKQMITPRRTTMAITTIYTLTVLSFAPLYTTHSIGWKFDCSQNRTILMIVIQGDYNGTQASVYFIHGITYLLAFLLVVALTLTLIRKLRQKSTWRETASAHQDKSMSKKDRSTMNMVALIAAILIVCYTPAVLLAVTTFLIPEFSVGGRFYNMYYIMWSFALLLENINSGVNIFLYIKMSSKYRKTLQEICGWCRHPDRLSNVRE